MKKNRKNKRSKGILILIIMMIVASLAGCANTDTSTGTEMPIAATAEDANLKVISVSQLSEEQAVVSGEFEDVDLSELEDVLNQADNAVNLGNWEAEGEVLAVESGSNGEGESLLIQSAGTYILEGSYDGQIIVDSQDEDDVVLVLNGAQLSNDETSPIFVSAAKRVVIVLAAGTENSLVDTSAYMEESDSEEERINGAIYAKSDLVFAGTGSLEIEAADKSGILAKDAVVVLDGNLTINASRNGIKANDLFWMVDGDVNVIAGKDGIQSKAQLQIDGGNLAADSAEDALHADGMIRINAGTLTLATGDDGIHADTYLEINGGIIEIPESYEGLESKNIVINGGEIMVVASDDGVNIPDTASETVADESPMRGGEVLEGQYLVINGGTLTVDAQGDGIDSNGHILMTGGNVTVNGPTDFRDGFIDYNGTFELTGGVLTGIGSVGMAQAPSETSTQESVFVTLDEAMDAGTILELVKENGEVLLRVATIKTFQGFVFSSSELSRGETVTCLVNGEEVETVEISDTITYIGEYISMEGGARPGGQGPRPEGGEPGMDNRPAPGAKGSMMPEADAGTAATDTIESKG